MKFKIYHKKKPVKYQSGFAIDPDGELVTCCSEKCLQKVSDEFTYALYSGIIDTDERELYQFDIVRVFDKTTNNSILAEVVFDGTMFYLAEIDEIKESWQWDLINSECLNGPLPLSSFDSTELILVGNKFERDW